MSIIDKANEYIGHPREVDEGYEVSMRRDAYAQGYKDAIDKTMIDKACKWITNNWREYVYQDGDGIVHFGHWENDFRKAMEE